MCLFPGEKTVFELRLMSCISIFPSGEFFQGLPTFFPPADPLDPKSAEVIDAAREARPAITPIFTFDPEEPGSLRTEHLHRIKPDR